MLLDTAGHLCCHHAAELQHAEAFRHFSSAPARLTHHYVLAEFVPLCESRGLDRVVALDFVLDLHDNPHVEFVWVDEALQRSALNLFRSRLDRTYSLCDGVSFILMREFVRLLLA